MGGVRGAACSSAPGGTTPVCGSGAVPQPGERGARSPHLICRVSFHRPFVDFFIIVIYFLFGSHFILVLFSSHSSLLFCSIFFFFTHSRLSPLSGFSIPQTPHHFSRCYDKPWLINSKAGSPLRGSDYPDLQLPSSEVGSSPTAPGPVVAGGAPGFPPVAQRLQALLAGSIFHGFLTQTKPSASLGIMLTARLSLIANQRIEHLLCALKKEKSLSELWSIPKRR